MTRAFGPVLLFLLVVTAAAVAKKFWPDHSPLTSKEFEEMSKKLKTGNYILTYFELRNFAKGNITDTKVSVQNNSDWDNKYYPGNNLQHWQIQANFSVICPEIVNRGANSSIFTMSLLYDDKTVEQFQINQQALFGKPVDFKHIGGNGVRKMLWRKELRQLEVIVYEGEGFWENGKMVRP